jgi:hypothetical protein
MVGKYILLLLLYTVFSWSVFSQGHRPRPAATEETPQEEVAFTPDDVMSWLNQQREQRDSEEQIWKSIGASMASPEFSSPAMMNKIVTLIDDYIEGFNSLGITGGLFGGLGEKLTPIARKLKIASLAYEVMPHPELLSGALGDNLKRLMEQGGTNFTPEKFTQIQNSFKTMDDDASHRELSFHEKLHGMVSQGDLVLFFMAAYIDEFHPGMELRYHPRTGKLEGKESIRENALFALLEIPGVAEHFAALELNDPNIPKSTQTSQGVVNGAKIVLSNSPDVTQAVVKLATRGVSNVQPGQFVRSLRTLTNLAARQAIPKLTTIGSVAGALKHSFQKVKLSQLAVGTGVAVGLGVVVELGFDAVGSMINGLESGELTIAGSTITAASVDTDTQQGNEDFLSRKVAVQQSMDEWFSNPRKIAGVAAASAAGWAAGALVGACVAGPVGIIVGVAAGAIVGYFVQKVTEAAYDAIIDQGEAREIETRAENALRMMSEFIRDGDAFVSRWKDKLIAAISKRVRSGPQNVDDIYIIESPRYLDFRWKQKNALGDYLIRFVQWVSGEGDGEDESYLVVKNGPDVEVAPCGNYDYQCWDTYGNNLKLQRHGENFEEIARPGIDFIDFQGNHYVWTDYISEKETVVAVGNLNDDNISGKDVWVLPDKAGDATHFPIESGVLYGERDESWIRVMPSVRDVFGGTVGFYDWLNREKWIYYYKDASRVDLFLSGTDRRFSYAPPRQARGQAPIDEMDDTRLRYRLIGNVSQPETVGEGPKAGLAGETGSSSVASQTGNSSGTGGYNAGTSAPRGALDEMMSPGM